MNFLHGVWCPSVVKVRQEKPGQPATPIFRWQEGATWHEGDELPEHIAHALPGYEWSACEFHRHCRMATRRAA